jgi:hypothetical protein
LWELFFWKYFQKKNLKLARLLKKKIKLDRQGGKRTYEHMKNILSIIALHTMDTKGLNSQGCQIKQQF